MSELDRQKIYHLAMRYAPPPRWRYWHAGVAVAASGLALFAYVSIS